MTTKSELIQHYRWLRQYGLNDSHSGNASIRNDKDIWVTPTGACADTLTEKELVKCKLDCTIGEGASLDAPLHVAIYQHNDSARCVLHGHGPYSIALTMQGDDLVLDDFEGSYYFGRVPVLNIAFDDYLTESPERVARTLEKNRICIIKGHGIYAQADSINLAYKWVCTLEQCAKIKYLANMIK